MPEQNLNVGNNASEVEYEVVQVTNENPNAVLPAVITQEQAQVMDQGNQVVYVPDAHGQEIPMVQEAQVKYDEETGLPVFNIEQLSQDIHGIVEDKLKFAEEKLNTMAQGAAGASKLITDSMLEDYKKEVKQVFGDIKEQLLEEVRQGRDTINIVDGSGVILNTLSSQDNDHHKFNDVVKSLAIHHKVLLVGPAG